MRLFKLPRPTKWKVVVLVCAAAAVCLSVYDHDNLKKYEWIFMKHVINDHCLNISLKLHFVNT